MTVVLKLGGSLFSLNDLIPKLRVVMQHLIHEHCLIVSGGGTTADIVRDWSQIFPLNDEAAHWLAIASLDFNRLLLQELLKYVSVRNQVEAEVNWSRSQKPLLLNMTDFLRNEEDRSAQAIPHDWTVTSDSLAAWAATRWPADELILLKSIPTPHGLTVQEASDQGMVDRYFPRIADQLKRIRWCNLRAPNIQIESWH